MGRFIELLLVMTEKELRARYKHTFFGFFWIVVNPLLQMVAIGFVFTFVMKQQIKNYYFYLFIGLLIWNFFSLSLTKATPSIVYERALIKKAKFDREIIPLSIILSNFIHLLIAMFLFTIPVLFLGTLSFVSVVYILAGFLLLIFFTVGLSFLVSALNVKYRDINFLVQAALIIWFYATPIIYSFDIIPRQYFWLWRLNPLTSILQLFQHGYLNFSPPGPMMLTANILVIVLVSVCGIILFHQESKNFDDWV